MPIHERAFICVKCLLPLSGKARSGSIDEIRLWPSSVALVAAVNASCLCWDEYKDDLPANQAATPAKSLSRSLEYVLTTTPAI